MSRRRGGLPVLTGILVLFGIGLIIQVLPYLIAAVVIAVLIWSAIKLGQVVTRTSAARQLRAATALGTQQQAELQEQQRLEAFLLPEDHEWMRRWT